MEYANALMENNEIPKAVDLYRSIIEKYEDTNVDDDDEKSKHVEKIIKDNFDLSPRGIREMLSLNKPIYECTAAYGHFGRKPGTNGSFWEKTDKIALFKK